MKKSTRLVFELLDKLDRFEVNVENEDEEEYKVEFNGSVTFDNKLMVDLLKNIEDEKGGKKWRTDH